MKQRELDLDFIKVIASVMVIMLHIGNVYMRSDYFGGSQVYHYFGMFYSVFFRTCVPLFVMISGYLYFESKSNDDYKLYYIKTLKRIIFPTILISIFYCAISAIREYSLYGIISWNKYGKDILSGNAYSHLWYMYMICGLYLFAPILRLFRNKLEKYGILLCGGILCAFGVCLAFLFDFPWPLLFLQYLGYFVLGWGLKKNKNTNKKMKIISLIGSMLIMFTAFLVTVFQEIYSFHPSLQIYKYLSPVTIVASIMLFWGLTGCKINSQTGVWISRLAKHNLGIYFIHQLYIDILYHWILRDNAIYLFPLFFIPVVVCIIYLLSFVTSVGWSNIIKPIRR